MKAFQILGAGTLLPSFSYALVGISWSIEGAPATGVKNITFPMTMPDTPHVAGYYYAQQYSFAGIDGMGYTGLQPRDDNGTGPVIHAVFSSFTKGTTTSDPNCHQGADGGDGVSCAVEANLSYDDQYELLVENTEGTTWTGTLYNMCKCKTVHIGTYTLPAGATGIQSSQVGFMEYYPNNGPNKVPCSGLPYGSVIFGAPTSDTPGVTGKLDAPYEYGDCVGSVGFQKQQIDSSWSSTVGFKK
ncbi:hypothetical protein K461DRAFT_279987 [Myriangium duriaei CBS 260.36]|uniref:Uncharacterized protein n=1 Tax=Myriangium duriaei CBS 260.36 TaxID=1168546 RepID=A0A9P4MEH8_9PEZI|nr:hypothetical protein K461DRAFT_279987 [Myriangium duriaei CBS 260.36]